MKYAVKIIAAMITAAVMVASAAVCVSAENSTILDCGVLYYTYNNSTSKFYTKITANNSLSNSTWGTNTFSGAYIKTNIESGYTYTIDIAIQSSGTTYGENIYNISYSDQDWYKAGNDYRINSFNDININDIIFTSNISGDLKTYQIIFNSNNINIQGLYYILFSVFPYSNGYQAITVANYNISATYDPDSSNYDELYLQYLTTIINYGSGNSLPSGGSDLGLAQTDLSSAEDALSNKSDSLASSVSNQWTTYKSTTQTFVTDIKPSATAVSTIYTNFVDSLPDEIKALLISIPILIFLGWLIGRVRG